MTMVSRNFMGLGAHGFHRVHYAEWGASDNPRVIVCVHGLTRNAHDFDVFAEAMCEDFRLVAVDVIGRGESEWVANKQAYQYPQYLGDMAALIARLDVERIDWVGTSMGGVIGMMLAAQPNSPIRRLVVNDVGPFVPKEALERIAEYVGSDPVFSDLGEAESYFRTVHEPFGPLSDEDWRRLTLHSTLRTDDGQIRLKYDPAIGNALHEGPLEDVDLWPIWEAIACPTLLLRGAQSDVLPAEIAEGMKTRGPRASVVEFSGVGHAPMLMSPDQINAVRDWLQSTG